MLPIVDADSSHKFALQRSSLDDILQLRKEYLDNLLEAQELLLELSIHDAECFVFEIDGKTAGYVCIDEQVILEFHVVESYINQVDEIFLYLLDNTSIQSALIKSFDHMFLSCALNYQKGLDVVGLLGRHYRKTNLFRPPVLFKRRLAYQEDLTLIKEVEQNVFTQIARMQKAIERKHVYLYFSGDDLLGFALIQTIVQSRPDVDLGLVLVKHYRRLGIGPHLLQDLIEHCFTLGLNPVGGCAAENIASRRAAERVGFISQYRLLKVHFR